MRLHDLPYFNNLKEAEEVLKLFARPDRPIILPTFGDVRDEVNRLSEIANQRALTTGDLLLSYQRLRESHSHTDVFCGWTTPAGSVCGAQMHIDVTAVGAYYQCESDTSHRTPK